MRHLILRLCIRLWLAPAVLYSYRTIASFPDISYRSFTDILSFAICIVFGALSVSCPARFSAISSVACLGLMLESIVYESLPRFSFGIHSFSANYEVPEFRRILLGIFILINLAASILEGRDVRKPL